MSDNRKHIVNINGIQIPVDSLSEFEAKEQLKIYIETNGQLIEAMQALTDLMCSQQLLTQQLSSQNNTTRITFSTNLMPTDTMSDVDFAFKKAGSKLDTDE